MGAALEFQDIGIEANLDIESSWPIIWPQKVINFQTDDQYHEMFYSYKGFYNSKPPCLSSPFSLHIWPSSSLVYLNSVCFWRLIIPCLAFGSIL